MLHGATSVMAAADGPFESSTLWILVIVGVLILLGLVGFGLWWLFHHCRNKSKSQSKMAIIKSKWQPPKVATKRPVPESKSHQIRTSTGATSGLVVKSFDGGPNVESTIMDKSGTVTDSESLAQSCRLSSMDGKSSVQNYLFEDVHSPSDGPTVCATRKVPVNGGLGKRGFLTSAVPKGQVMKRAKLQEKLRAPVVLEKIRVATELGQAPKTKLLHLKDDAPPKQFDGSNQYVFAIQPFARLSASNYVRFLP